MSDELSTKLYNAKYGQIFNSGSDIFATSFDWSIRFWSAPSIFTNGDDMKDQFLNKNLLLKTIGWNAPDIPDAEPMTVNIHGHNLTQAGLAPNYGQVTFTYQDTANLNVTRYFNAIEYAMDDPKTHSTRGRSPYVFRFGFTIEKLDPMGNSIMRWRCYPCTLAGVQADLATGTSDKSIQGRVTVSFKVDYFDIEYPESSGKYTNGDDPTDEE